jgi:hypothetical protein
MMISGASMLLEDLTGRIGVDTGEFGAELFGVISGVRDPASEPSRSSTVLAAALSPADFSLRA